MISACEAEVAAAVWFYDSCPTKLLSVVDPLSNDACKKQADAMPDTTLTGHYLPAKSACRRSAVQ